MASSTQNKVVLNEKSKSFDWTISCKDLYNKRSFKSPIFFSDSFGFIISYDFLSDELMFDLRCRDPVDLGVDVKISSITLAFDKIRDATFMNYDILFTLTTIRGSCQNPIKIEIKCSRNSFKPDQSFGKNWIATECSVISDYFTCVYKNCEYGSGVVRYLGNGYDIGYFRSDCKVTLLCEYELTEPVCKSVINTFDYKQIIFDSFVKLWKDGEFCDYELVAPCGRKLRTHKFVLAARSPVFRAMFQHDLKEKIDGLVKIDDLKYEILEDMLHFMYCGKTENLNDQTINKFSYAAEKYEIDDLKRLCQKFLKENLSVGNAINTLKICKLYNMVELKPHVDAFITKNSKQIYCLATKQNVEEVDIFVKLINEMAEEN